jgi:hypothetical protein
MVPLYKPTENYYSVRLSVTNGNRIAEAVKVIRKIKADSSGHVGRYSTTNIEYVNDF